MRVGIKVLPYRFLELFIIIILYCIIIILRLNVQILAFAN